MSCRPSNPETQYAKRTTHLSSDGQYTKNVRSKSVGRMNPYHHDLSWSGNDERISTRPAMRGERLYHAPTYQTAYGNQGWTRGDSSHIRSLSRGRRTSQLTKDYRVGDNFMPRLYHHNDDREDYENGHYENGDHENGHYERQRWSENNSHPATRGRGWGHWSQ